MQSTKVIYRVKKESDIFWDTMFFSEIESLRDFYLDWFNRIQYCLRKHVHLADFN